MQNSSLAVAERDQKESVDANIYYSSVLRSFQPREASEMARKENKLAGKCLLFLHDAGIVAVR